MGFRQFTLGFNGPSWDVDAGAAWLAWRDAQNARSMAVAVGSVASSAWLPDRPSIGSRADGHAPNATTDPDTDHRPDTGAHPDADHRPDPQPTPVPTPTAVPSFSPEPTPEPGRPPIIVGKINDQGTEGLSDDTLARGAVFEFRLDDGDKVYDAIADGPVLFTGIATHGVLVWTPPGPGFYWVTEVTPPAGLDISAPVLVPYLVTREAAKCFQLLDRPQACTRVIDSVGYAFVVIAESPNGEVVAVTNPPTSTSPLPEPASGSAPGLPVLLALGGLSLVLALLARPRSRRRPPPG